MNENYPPKGYITCWGNIPENEKTMQKSNLSNFGIVPLDDMDWAADQKPAVNRLFVDCWRSDPYGSRWMQLNTRLKPTVFKEAKKALTEKGLFVFKPEQSILDGRQTVCWMVRNLRGSKVKNFRKLEAGNPTSISEEPVSNPTLEAGNPTCKIGNPTLEAGNPTSISPQTLAQSAVQKPSESFQYPIGSISSSISRDRAPEESGEEEEAKILKNAGEEANQGDVVNPESIGEAKVASQLEDIGEPEIPVKPETLSTPQHPASLEVKPEVVGQPKDLELDRDSAAAPPPQKSDLELLKWLVDVKIPALELNEAPRNLLAYAKAMVRRDGDALREEFGEVVRDRQFREQCNSLTEKLEARVDEWRQAGISLTLFYAFDGRPQILLDGITIPGDEFLKKAIGSQPALQPISAFLNPEDAAKRKSRMSRLKFAEKFGECPGLEFLAECWKDVLLRSQIRQTIKKHPRWGMFFNTQGQLEQFGEHPAEMQDGFPGSQLSHDQIEFAQPQEVQMNIELQAEDDQYQYLKHLSKSEMGRSPAVSEQLSPFKG